MTEPSSSPSSGGPRGYLRFPGLSATRPDLLVFTAEDDVWVATLEPGGAGGSRLAGGVRRLTTDRVPVSGARVSPDGSTVVYVGARDGAPELYAVPVDGGPSRRLTTWGDRGVRTGGFGPDGAPTAISAVDAPFRFDTWAWSVPLDGSAPRRLPHGPVTDLAFAPDGGGAEAPGRARPVVLGRGHWRDAAHWKRYRGGTAGRLWLDRTGDGRFELFAPGLDGQLVHPVVVRDAGVADGSWRVAFVSDHEGVGNVYSCDLDGADLRRHTDHEHFYARSAASDGTRVVYASAGELWLLDGLAADSVPVRLEVDLRGSGEAHRERPEDAAGSLGDLRADRTGRASVVEVRGTVHWLTHRDGPAHVLAATPGVRAREPRLLGPDRAVWVTDAEGDDALEVRALPGDGTDPAPVRLAAGRLGRVLELEPAPDGSSVAVATHDGRVLVVDASSGGVREVERSDEGDASGLAWSPDSAWLAWSAAGPEPLRSLRLARVGGPGATRGDEVVEVTPRRFIDTEPCFTPDGHHLAFVSVRTFDPVYDAHVFDLSFPSGARPHLLPLAAATPSPFGPSLAGRPPGDRDDPDEPGAGVPPSGGGAPSAPASAVPVVVDPEGLAARVVAVPVPEGRYSDLHTVPGALLWLRTPIGGVLGEGLASLDDRTRPVLERFELSTRSVTVLAEGVDSYAVSADGTRLVLRDGDAVRVVPADQPVPDAQRAGRVVDVDLGRVRLTRRPVDEWRQMLDETARLMRDHFWVDDLAGVDWAAAVDRYRPLVDRLGSRDDLSDLLWEVQGEMGTSHAYERPHDAPVERAMRVGRLGADLAPGPDGTWVVERVLPGDSSAPRARSPLGAPGVGVQQGDAVVEVGGRPVDPTAGPAPLLVGTADEPVDLLVRSAGTGATRRVAVVPLADDRQLRYLDWVAGRRAHVREASGGRLGYLHVPDMVGTGWAQLHRDLRTEVPAQGLVVDLRHNGGGHTSQLVLERLAERVVGWTVARHLAPRTYPRSAPRGPLVFVLNEFAGSDADIASTAVRLRGLGPIVGTRSWGGVVGIDSRYQLVDGVTVTQPRYAFWFDGPGWSVENHGVDPDVEVLFPPQAWAAGTDPQLDEAVRIALERVEQHQPLTAPDPATRPGRAAPPLPPRPGRSDR